MPRLPEVPVCAGGYLFKACPTTCATLLRMAQRSKRSISLPPKIAEAIEQAAEAQGTTFSAWVAEVAAHRLRLDAGRRSVAEWEIDHGALTDAELADGLTRARALLQPASAKRHSRERSA